MEPEGSTYRTLVRHFANRFFDSELVGAGGNLRESASTVAALLGAMSVVVAYVTVTKHWLMNARTPERVRAAMEWADREFILSLSMAVVAAIAVLCWQSVFPDKRDCLILSALPVPVPVMMLAKISALGGVFLTATVAANFASTFFFPVAVARHLTVSEVLRFYGSHTLAVGAASAFVFLTVLAMQALLANLLPFRAFQRSSAWVQLVALFGVLFLFFVIPPIASPEALLDPANRRVALLLPPFWFLGLYQKLLGTQHAFVDVLAGLAVRALSISALSAAALYAIAYRRVMRRTIEDSGAVGQSTKERWMWLSRMFDRWMVRSPRERAAFHFIWRTMTRNRGHRLMLAAYTAVGLVYVVSGIASLVKKSGGQALLAPNTDLSALPLILPFFVLLGLRALFAIPVDLQSNWIFRITDAGRPDEYVRAARKAMLMIGIVPVCVLAVPAYGMLWGWQIAAAHVAMSLLASMAVLEWMMAGFRKVPFTCPWMPGKGNLKAAFGAYAVLFLGAAYVLVGLELALARNPIGSAIGIGFCLWLWIHRLRIRRELESPDVCVMWEEPPVWHMQTLELSR